MADPQYGTVVGMRLVAPTGAVEMDDVMPVDRVAESAAARDATATETLFAREPLRPPVGRERASEAMERVVYPTGRMPLPGDNAVEDATTLPSATRRFDAAAGPPALPLVSKSAVTPATAAVATDGVIVDGFDVSVARVLATMPVASTFSGVADDEKAPNAATMLVASASFVVAMAMSSDADGPPVDEVLAVVTAVSSAELNAADARSAAAAPSLETLLVLDTVDANASVVFSDAPGASGGFSVTLDHTTPRDPRESIPVAARSMRVGVVGSVAPDESVVVSLNDGTEVVSVPLPRATPGRGVVEKDDCIDRSAA